MAGCTYLQEEQSISKALEKNKNSQDKGFLSLLEPDPYSLIVFQNGELRFQDTTHLRNVLNKLEQEYEAWNDAFENQWYFLDDEAYNAKIEELAFDEDKTLKDFERRFPNYRSLRLKIQAEEDAWLNGGMTDINQDPDNLYDVDDEFLRVVMNRQARVWVGNTLYYVSNFGRGEQGTSSGKRAKALLCETRHWRLSNPVEYDNNKRFTAYLSIPRPMWWGAIKARVKAYKFKNGKWKPYRTLLGVRSYGTYRAKNDCSANEYVSPFKQKRRKTLTVTKRVDAHLAFANYGEIYSQNYSSGQYLLFNLVW